MKNTFLFLAAFISMSLADSALAYRIYNKSSQEKIEAWGEHCPKCFHGTIKSGDSKACPGGEAGCKNKTEISAKILVPISPYSNDYACKKCTTKVPAHGWVEFHDNVDNPRYTNCSVYDKNGKLLSDQLMENADGCF